ncbi:hypothetical protein AUJ14_04930 [Candidatus Micrarchaeota archaeon CG1_02_55_22]|nr:MAG: hypothetical protein AUJ14_04930 [Candidatus Micrarchaeota archaeon CG1_02_55_22]
MKERHVGWYELKYKLFSLVLALFLVAGLVAAADLTSPLVTQQNDTTVLAAVNVSITFAMPSPMNVSNITIGFPAGFVLTGGQIFNTSALTTGVTIPGGLLGGTVSSRNITIFLDSNASNLSGQVSLNVSDIKLPGLAGSYIPTIYVALNDTTMIAAGPNTTASAVNVTLANLDRPLFNSTNTTTANTVANITINFTIPAAYAFNVTNISIEFPANFSVASAKIYNTSALQTGSVIPTGTLGGQVNGRNVSFLLSNNNTNLSGELQFNVSEVGLPYGTGTYTFRIHLLGLRTEAADTSINSPLGPNVTLNGLTVTADTIVNVTGSANASTAVAGAQVLYTITGQDAYGNTNTTGGFNFGQNNTLMLSYVSGNGTTTGLFQARSNGTASVNVSSARDLTALQWNRTMTNITVTTGNIFHINMSTTYYPTVSNSSVNNTKNGTLNVVIANGYDAYGNLNNTGGFNWTSGNITVAQYFSGNGTNTAVFNTSRSGTSTLTAYAGRDLTTSNSTTGNVTAAPNLTSINAASIGAGGATITWTTDENANAKVEFGPTTALGQNTTATTTYTQSQSVLVSEQPESSIVHYRVWSCSPYGVCSVDTEIKNFTTTARASGSSSGGSSSGGSGASSTPTATPVPTVTPVPTPSVPSGEVETTAGAELRVTQTLEADEEVTLVLSSDATANTRVSSMVLTMATETTGLTVSVERLDSKPAEAPAIEGALAYLSLTATPAGSVAQAQVFFRVSKAEAGNLAENAITLVRLDGGEWTELSTKRVSSDSEYYYFVATTPGFSFFAITKTALPNTTPAPSGSAAPSVAATATPVVAASATDYTLPIIVVVIIVLAAAYWLNKEKLSKSKK